MPEVRWIRITTDMFDDEKIKLLEAMPDADTLLIIWVKLICQAGKVNADGYIFLSETISYTEEQLATVFNRPVNTVKLALRAFEQLQMIEFNERGAILLPNFSKHQNIEGLGKIRENTRLRVAKHRRLKAGKEDVTDGNVTVTQQSRVDKRRKEKNKKNTYGEFKNVLLSDIEYKKIVDRFGEAGAKEKIEVLSAGIASKGYRYKDHYATILAWDKRDKKEGENGARRGHNQSRRLPTTYRTPEEIFGESDD